MCSAGSFMYDRCARCIWGCILEFKILIQASRALSQGCSDHK